jgi:hypothetical protein
MNARNLLTGFFLLIATLTQGAIAVSCARQSCSVTVLARGPAGLRIEGKGSEVSLEEDASALTFKVPLFPKEHEPVEGTADGDLTLHGQSRAVKVHYRAELGSWGTTKVRASLQLDMRDFDIKAPSYLGVTVAPKVEVNAELAMKGT